MGNNDIETLERKTRVLKSFIKADKHKGDEAALKRHQKSLMEHQKELRRLKSASVS